VNGVAEQKGSNRITLLGTLFRGDNLRVKTGGRVDCMLTDRRRTALIIIILVVVVVVIVVVVVESLC